MIVNGQEVCDTCGGNCGQCGTSIGMGVPPSMDMLIRSLHGAEAPVPKPKKVRDWSDAIMLASCALGLFIGLAIPTSWVEAFLREIAR